MSEIINNRENGQISKDREERQGLLKKIILDLHNGKDVEAAKAEFEKHFKDVSAREISEMEQGLVKEGMPITEIQKLCDVHASVFKGSIEEIHNNLEPKDIEGHPVNTFMNENREIEKLVEKIRRDVEEFGRNDKKENVYKLLEGFNLLWDLDKHYSRKENLLFPYLEKYGVTAPPKVMWGVDDEIRDEIKEIKGLLSDFRDEKNAIVGKIEALTTKVLDMIFKEESILFPMCLETLTEDEWVKIMDESDEIGYCIIEPGNKWKPDRVRVEEAVDGDELSRGYVKFETGILSTKELSLILNTLPFDITFIDKDDVVRYFSLGKDRIFARTKAVIGRTVQNCHPPTSVHIVNKMLEDFKSGKKDNEDFWIKMGPAYVYIRYFAVRDENNEYMGTIEVTQNIKPIKELEGEKRLLSE